MTIATEEKNSYVAEFDRLERAAAKQPTWFRPVRKAAIAHFAEMGFPTTRHEDWRYTNVAPIANTVFRAPSDETKVPTLQDLQPFLLPGEGQARLVFVNGRYAPRLSTPGRIGDQVTLAALAPELAGENRVVQAHLADQASYEDDAFIALNTALFGDGAFVHVPAGRAVDQPIHLLFVATPEAEPTVCHPRTLIVVEENSQVSIVESYVGLGSGAYFTNAVTEIAARPNAVVHHCKVQRESDQAYHVGTLRIHQERASVVDSHCISLGASLSRNNVNPVLDGEGCDCTLNGLYMLTGRQHCDNHLRVEHAKPHCQSWEYYKGLLDDCSHGVFTGRIVVHKNAQKTDAKQNNKNLLLSADAVADSKPQLEIFADDVKCTHGVAIGQIDEEALFYLRSRGLSKEAAKSLLIYAFAAESLGEIKIEAVRRQLENVLFTRLPLGDFLRDANS